MIISADYYSIKDDTSLFENKIADRYNYIKSGRTQGKEGLSFRYWDFTGFNFNEYSAERLKKLTPLQRQKFWQYSDFAYSNMSGCNLNNVLYPGYIDFSFSKFFNCNFAKANMQGTWLNCNFDNSIMTEVKLGYSTIADCSFVRADFTNSILYGSACNCDFTQAIFYGAHFNCTFESSVFEAAKGIITFAFDPRGYCLHIIADASNNILFVKAGCRWFNEKQAIEHWGSDIYENRKLGKKYVEAIEFVNKLFALDKPERYDDENFPI